MQEIRNSRTMPSVHDPVCKIEVATTRARLDESRKLLFNSTKTRKCFGAGAANYDLCKWQCAGLSGAAATDRSTKWFFPNNLEPSGFAWFTAELILAPGQDVKNLLCAPMDDSPSARSWGKREDEALNPLQLGFESTGNMASRDILFPWSSCCTALPITELVL